VVGLEGEDEDAGYDESGHASDVIRIDALSRKPQYSTACDCVGWRADGAVGQGGRGRWSGV